MYVRVSSTLASSALSQTIAMARDVHRRRYRMGPGYMVSEDGKVEERYWEVVKEGERGRDGEGGGADGEYRACALPKRCRMPYRIELVGVVCDAHLAVVRGMR